MRFLIRKTQFLVVSHDSIEGMFVVVAVVVARGIRLGLLSPVWLAPPYAATADRAWRERLSEHR